MEVELIKQKRQRLFLIHQDGDNINPSLTYTKKGVKDFPPRDPYAPGVLYHILIFSLIAIATEVACATYADCPYVLCYLDSIDGLSKSSKNGITFQLA